MCDILGLIFVQWNKVKVQSTVAKCRYLKILMVKIMPRRKSTHLSVHIHLVVEPDY